MRTSSATDRACILRMTWPRWTFTVTRPSPSSAAICLFARPVTRNQRETITSSAVLGFSSAPKDRNTNEVRVPS